MQTYDKDMFIESDLSSYHGDMYELSQENTACLCKLDMQLVLSIEHLSDMRSEQEACRVLQLSLELPKS